MKKLVKLGIPLFIVVMLLGTIGARADYNVTVGTIFTYDVVASTWTVADGTNTGTGSGFTFEGSQFPVGTQVEVEVLAASGSSIDFNETIGSVYDESSASPFGDALGMVLLLFFPILIGAGTMTWNQTEVELGPALMGIYFLEPDALSEIFTELSNNTYVSSNFEDPEFVFNQVGGQFDNTTTIAVFDWVLDMDYVNATEGTNFGGLFRFKVAFNTNTGQVKGYNLDMDYTGTVGGTNRQVTMNQKVEEVGFDIGGFAFGGGFIPGFEWFVALPAIALLGAIAVIVRKRK
ncbi:MAG: choice-of-anchor S family protein [Candidatus Heimdallarchaeota archaeon]